MKILGIESSCDDTAVAIVDEHLCVHANVVTNQDAFHARYGGIVPEIAGRAHVSVMSAAIEDALLRANCTFADLAGVAVTAGPGLIGSLVVGVASAKSLAWAHDLPLYAINHLHGHIFAPFLDARVAPQFPLLALLVSGGHSQLVAVHSPTEFRILGRTRDDAAGEAFDKTARLLGLPFPGGPALDAVARDGNPRAVQFPRHAAVGDALDLSFSGVKTAARRYIEMQGAALNVPDTAASFQAAIVAVLMDRLTRALDQQNYVQVVVSGGVAANSGLRAALADWSGRRGIAVHIPPLKYCTDNAAMIAAAAVLQGEAVRCDPLTLTADPRLAFSGACRA